jgi:Secretion system C-terminal sorting domain
VCFILIIKYLFMKKILPLLTAFAFSFCGISQTTIFSENFENTNAFTMNTNDLAGASAYNTWLVNTIYSGGSGTFVCLGFPFSFTINNTPSQPVGISGAPSSKYMHIAAQAAISSGINCASYIPSDGTCVTNESNFSKMTNSISTVGFTNVNFNFWWMCAGSATAFGELYYSLNGGTSWILKQSNLNNMPNWSQMNHTDPAWNNAANLKFAFRFVNTTATAASDPPLCIDQITVSGVCAPVYSTFTQTACDAYTWINGTTYTSNNTTATDTLISAGGCDSIITLNLTINNSTTGVATHTACGSFTWLNGVTYTANNNSASHILSTTAGCDSIVTLNLTINNVSNLSTTTNGITITANGTGASYQWLNCNNNFSPIPGATGQSFTPSANGSYAVIITQNGCSDTSTCSPITTIGLAENSFGSDFILYPNPTTGVFTLDLGETHESVTVKVTDLKGRLIQTNQFASAHLLNLTIEEEAGVYFLIIESSENKGVIRLIKE